MMTGVAFTVGALSIPARLLHIDTTGNGMADTHVVASGLGKAEALLPKAEVATLPDGSVEVRPRASSFLRAVVPAGVRTYMFNADSIIPIYVTNALSRWFGVLFLLTLLAAAQTRSITVTRVGMILGIVTALGICNALFGVPPLLTKSPNWPVVDPLVLTLPLSLRALIVVRFVTKRPSEKLLAGIF